MNIALQLKQFLNSSTTVYYIAILFLKPARKPNKYFVLKVFRFWMRELTYFLDYTKGDQCCGTVTICYGSGSGSGSDF